ncbi:MAG: Zn-ribbon domain-containing OB-fold protein [Candidatus Diapherotrites archaeon]|nr:Zn-ribbon domain-containing OB-fold protein [Candidatus Diapherotrites archaeon]
MSNYALPLIWRKFPERYNLLGNKCTNCGRSYFPSRKICPNCRRKGHLIEEVMPKEGKIISFTKVFSAPEGFEEEVPYFLAIIELINGVRLLAQIVDNEDHKVLIGAKVKMVFRKISEKDEESPIAYGYKFKIVE